MREAEALTKARPEPGCGSGRLQFGFGAPEVVATPYEAAAWFTVR
jgi:hypothetical protein